MEADTSRLESAIAGAESRLFNLEREFKTLDLLFAGKTRQNVVFPSGVSGFNQIFEVIAMPLAIVEADEGLSGTFLGSYDADAGKITIGHGSYQFPLGTNVDVAEDTTGGGKFAYACIKQNAGGGLVEFKIEITGNTKDPTNRDNADEFVEWSNVLLGEVMSVPGEDGAEPTSEFIQRRTGNLSLIRRIINGSFCLWPETTGGSSL